MFGSSKTPTMPQQHKTNLSKTPTIPQPVLNQKRDAKILNHNLGKAMNSYETIRNLVERGDKVVSPVLNVASSLQKSGVHIGI